MFGINGWEIVLLALIAVFVLGPERLPEYAQKLAQLIKKARVMAEGAKGQLKDQLGPEYQDINWRQYDPRQYDGSSGKRSSSPSRTLHPRSSQAAPTARRARWPSRTVRPSSSSRTGAAGTRCARPPTTSTPPRSRTTDCPLGQ